MYSLTDIIYMSKLTVIYMYGQLIYSLQIPLLNYIRFNLYRLHPFPIRQNILDKTICKCFLLSFEYVALEFNKQSYIPITYKNLQNCKKIKSNYICKNFAPTQTVDNSSECEIKILSGLDVDLNDCNIKIRKLSKTIWIRLSQKNSWAFSATDNDNISLRANINN